MRTNRYTNLALTAIAVFLGILALRPLAGPPPVNAYVDAQNIYIEPGTTTIRRPDGGAQMQGKVVIDLSTGNIWGFPTLTSAPYPVDSTKPLPPVSEPMYLGKFDFSKMRR